MLFRVVVLLLIGLAAAPVRAGEPAARHVISPVETAGLRVDEATGLAIYRHDKAASVATDAVLLLDSFSHDGRTRGWITEGHADSVTVTFIDATPAALYRATVSDAGKIVGKVEAFATPQPLTPYEAGAAAARAAALGTKFKPCSDRYNTVVLPVDGTPDEKWLVYLLPATTSNRVVPIGGTYRIEVDKNRVVAQRGFTKSCIALDNDPRTVALVITHLLDPTPTEVHVFWSLWAHKDIYVITVENRATWAIHDGHVRLVK